MIIAQIADSTTNQNVTADSSAIINLSPTTSQPINIYKPKGNLSCLHFNYDLLMSFFNSSNDIEELMSKTSEVNCSWKKSNGTIEWETRSFPEVRKVEIKNSTILRIPEKLFANFSKIFIFRARDVKIQEIHVHDFTSAELVFLLDISRNEIKKLEKQLFSNLKAIKEIDLSSNKIEIIDDEAFDKIGINLTRIDLSNNKIKSFKEDYFLTMIINASRKWLPFDINLRNNEIEVIEPSQKNPIILPEINLQLSGNKIKNLELLKIVFFEIILKNFTLESVNVNASYVWADYNKLKTYRIKGKTRSLSLNNNLLTNLSYDDYLSVTRNVFLSENCLTSDVIYEMLKKVINLEILDISNNPIKTLKIDMFSEQLLLQKLILSNTSLTHLSYGMFAYQTNLRVLDISNNNFITIDFHVFSSNINLEILDISGTNISKIDDCRKIGEILPKLKLLGVEDNNWKCNVLSKAKACLNSQLIKFMIPDKPTKNESNIMGVKCSHVQNTTQDEMSSTTPSAILQPTAGINAFISDIISRMNQMDEKISVTKTAIQGVTSLELGLSVVLAVLATVLVIFGINKVKNYLKINRLRMPRLSRRNSPDTIITYDSNSIGR